MVFEEELRDVERRTGARLHLLVGDHNSRKGAALLSAGNLLRLAPRIADSDVYVCGPDGMMDATREVLDQLGVPEDQIHSERFALAA